MEVVFESVRSLTGAERAAIALEAAGRLVVAAGSGMAPETVGLVLDPGSSAVARVFVTGEALLTGDLGSLRDDSRSLNHSRSAVAVGLEHAGHRHGILCCSSPRPDAFAADDVQALELLAGFIAPAVAQARAFEALREEVERRRAAEAELRTSRERLAAIVETMAEG